jgi:hypothetical protein
MQNMVRYMYMLRNLWNRTSSKVVAAALLLLVLVLAAGNMLGWWSWKTLIGWSALVEYINPDNATEKKEALQVYAVIVAGVIASITAAVGLANLRLTRRNLEQQRPGYRSASLLWANGQAFDRPGLAYYQKNEGRELARAQTMTLLRELDATRKGSLVVFLKAAGLIQGEDTAVVLASANLKGANLEGATMPDGTRHI